MKKIEVWDLPVRLFHWALLILVAISITTGKLGGIEEMEIHMLSGYGIITLLLFRLMWGFAGGTYVRFTQFVRGPGAVFRYLRSLPTAHHQPAVGHNAAAGWMVLALLAMLLVQGTTGLFATDDIFVEGPLTHLVSEDTSGTLTRIHHLSIPFVVGLIVLHVTTVAYYFFGKRINLLLPMITGSKEVEERVAGVLAEPLSSSLLWRALALILSSALAVYAVVNWV